MTNKELRKLRRSELLELMVMLSDENEKMHNQIELLDLQLGDRTIQLQDAGSIAEASVKIGCLFEVAQETANRYLENIRRLNDDTQITADSLIEETRRKCVEMEAEAQRNIDGKWNSLKERLDRYCEAHKELKEHLSALIGQSNMITEAKNNDGSDFAHYATA